MLWHVSNSKLILYANKNKIKRGNTQHTISFVNQEDKL